MPGQLKKSADSGTKVPADFVVGLTGFEPATT
jgi:hypothetical protein